MPSWIQGAMLLLLIACADSMRWAEPLSWTFMGVIDGFDYSRGSRAYFWKPDCPNGFLRIGDAFTDENIRPIRVLACVSGEEWELTPISHEMVTLIYDPPNSDLLFYRGFAPGPVAMLGTMVTTQSSLTPDLGRGKRSIEQNVDPNLQFYAAFSGICLGTHRWCDISARFESANQFILRFNPFEKLNFSMPGNLFLPSSTPNPSILGCLWKDCACGGCMNGWCFDDGRCYCHPDWMGTSCNQDVDECARGIARCDQLVECINEMPGYRCGPCPAGFLDVYGNGTRCDDIDECADPTKNNCQELGLNCTNLPGSFQCTDCAVGFYRPTPTDQCVAQTCGDGKWDPSEECDTGFGCFANNCTCAPLWEPTVPRSSDCQRQCGNLRLDPEEQCDGGEGCRPLLCLCNTGFGFRPINQTYCGTIATNPEESQCSRLSDSSCDECTQFNCIWCPNEKDSCVPRSRPTGGCTTTCQAVILPPVEDPGDNLNTVIVSVSIVGAALIVLAGIGIAVLIIYRRRKRVKRLEEERLNELERKRMAAVSKYGIARTDVVQAPLGEWNPPKDSTLILVEQLPFTLSKTVFDFHNGANQFQVNSIYLDRVTLTLKDKVAKPPKRKKKVEEDKTPLVEEHEMKQRSGEAEGVQFVFHSVDSHKYRIQFTPSSGFLKKGKEIDITVSMEVKMTAELELITGIELPAYHQHSFLMSPITSELSSFIDMDEVQLDSRKPIGDGAYGTVYKGMYRGQDVAVKVLKLQDLPEEMLDEFDREIDLLNKLRHKNIVQFIGASKVVGKLAILTEFIEFGNCGHLLYHSEKPVDVSFKVKIALDAARAIRFLHQNNILHRDIKPDNLLIVSLDGNAPVAAKLTDFGTSRAVSKLANQYTTGIGTPSYMAPEILARKFYDTKADVYSFGILLWALFTQKEPYVWLEHSWDVAQYVLDGKREKIPPECPPLYAQLIEQCWAHEPDDRPAMDSVIQALENIVKMAKFWTGM